MLSRLLLKIIGRNIVLIEDVVTLQVEPTSHCNAKCPHCPRFDVTHHEIFESTGLLHPDLTLTHIDVNSVLDNLDLDRMHNLSKVVIEGDKGDPMMHPQIEKLIDAFCLSPSQPIVTLSTNGSIRNKQWWSSLAKKGYKNLQVIFSIDGLADTNHLYRIAIDFNRIMENVSAFIDSGGTAIWKLIAFKHNHHQISDIKQLSRDLGFAALFVRQCDVNRFKNLDKWPVIVDKNTHWIEPIHIDEETLIFSKLPTAKKKPLSWNNKRICPNLAQGHLYITHQNQVIPCCMMHFDTQLKYPGTDRLKELCQGFENIDLSIHRLQNILKSDFYARNLRNSFVENQWHETCSKSCKKTILMNLENHVISH